MVKCPLTGCPFETQACQSPPSEQLVAHLQRSHYKIELAQYIMINWKPRVRLEWK